MPDAWINRLVVSGPEAEASAFERAAAKAEPGPPTSLSFVRLQALLAEEEQGGLEPFDPWDNSYGPSVPPPERESRQAPGAVDLTYSFILARYEPDELLIEVSRLFPNLCFVLGWVAPSNDEQMSRFIKDGQTLLYEVPESQKEETRSEIYRQYGKTADNYDEDNDQALFIEIEIDTELLDIVVKHWDAQVTQALENSR